MDAREVIFNELSKLPGDKHVTGDAFMICCPFHGDNAPSCGVNLTQDTDIPLGFFHCFSGDTEVLTNLGTSPIEDLVGRKGVKVLTEGGVWVNTVFRNYGKQRLYEIVVTRNTQTKSIFATAEHEWLRKGIKKRTKTRDLPVGFVFATPTPSRLAWKVVSVTKTDYIEDVYCCVVPGTHSFTLKDNILTGNCFGCREKGGWNKLAAHLGLQQLKDWELGFTGNGTKRANKKKRGPTEFQDADTALREAIYTNEAIPWPASVSWRGYEGTLLHKLGALYYNDKMTKQMMTFFPIYVNGKYRGGVRAYLEKQVSGNTYLTTKGSWVSNYGLLGYEFIKGVVRRHKYDAVVLVEGPRDALRLIKNNIPALSVLGVGAISERKMLKVLALTSRLNTVYVMPDNDKGGSTMFSNVKHHMRGLANVKHLRLPKPMKDGKLVKLDPDNCDQDIIDEVRLMFREHRHA